MTKKKTGKAVRDMKGPTEKKPAPEQVQIHAGNTAVLTVQLLSSAVKRLEKIISILEANNG